MQIITHPTIKQALNEIALIDAVAQAFIDFSNGVMNVPQVGYLPFTDPPGDMHIKYGHTKGDSVFIVKIATGFYDNPKRGLPSSNGLMLLISAVTGAPLALLQDEGFLTDSRTAAAGAVAARTLSQTPVKNVGIVGTGIQARMQLLYLRHVVKMDHICVWGRSETARTAYVQEMQQHGIAVTATDNLEDLCGRSNLIVTTTPATAPLIDADWITDGTHITAVGADAPGKQELDSRIFDRAAFTVFDSREQCLHHGEASHNRSVFTNDNSCELGALLANPEQYKKKAEAVTVADLTGIAAQDIAAAKTIWQQLNL